MNINSTILGQCIVFFIFVWFCMKYIWPPIILIIEKRQKDISDSLSAAEQAKKQLKLITVDMAEHVKKSKLEAKYIIENANKMKFKIINDAKIQAKLEYESIINNAEKEINKKYEITREMLRKQLAILVINATEKIIKQSMDISKHNDIINQVLDEL
uniref:ATP synthase subunit b n=1 Tax=Candidatus Aschnera chinzeii TaxID=1485666 RepID=A0AAT9G437_9ENTR|nr:MAG: F0F1 ATP synthase subunit B [Candidatus Aschnera chinzeii]